MSQDLLIELFYYLLDVKLPYIEKSDTGRFFLKNNYVFGGLTKIFIIDMQFLLSNVNLLMVFLLIMKIACLERYFSGMGGYICIPIKRFFKRNFYNYCQFHAEVYSEPCQTSKIERFAKIVNS